MSIIKNIKERSAANSEHKASLQVEPRQDPLLPSQSQEGETHAVIPKVTIHRAS